MKQFSLFGVLVLCISLILGCTQQTGKGSTSGKETVELRYMIWDNNQAPAYQQALDIFMDENPNIKVQLEVVPWGDYWSKLNTQAAGNASPDIFWTYVTPIPELSEKNVLLDLTNYIEIDGVDLTKYNQTLVKSLNYDGKQYGIPKDWDAHGLFYNKDLLKAAGYDEFPVGLEWDPEGGGTFVEFLQKLTVDKNGNHPNQPGFDEKNISQYGFNNGFSPQDLIGYIASNGGSFLDESGKLILDNEKTLKALQFTHDLIFKYHVAPDITQADTLGSEPLFYSSKVAIWQSGPWMLKPINENAGFEWGTTQVPRGPEGQFIRINGLTDSIYAKTKHPDEAWKVTKFLAGKTTQDILGETGTVFPALDESIPKFLEYYESIGLDASVFVEGFNGDTVADPTTLRFNEINVLWDKYIGLSYSGEMSLTEAVEKIVSEGNEILGK